MEIPFLVSLLFLSLLLSSASAGLGGGKYHGKCCHKKLFVFGDSYADTGNWSPSISNSWKPPYGMTFPGKPAGRFSDGQILTDFVASYFHIRSPIPYERRMKVASPKELQFGMNFAYGGTGVFDTDVSQPNMTSQINLFKNIITQGKVYTTTDLQSSIALVSLGGNDYPNYLKHGPQMNLSEFTKTVVHQLVLDLKRIHKIGVPKVAVTAMEPLGCLPAITLLTGYTNCSQSLNKATKFHNQLLQKSLDKLNKETPKPVFFVLDLYGAFLSALHRMQNQPGQAQKPLKPCCQGITSDYDCGYMEGNEAKYNVCDKPQLAFFWDKVHPAQHGWHQVYLAIRSTLRNLL